jgi:hypothetical protein
MDNHEKEELQKETIENIRKLVPDYDRLMEMVKTRLVTGQIEQYNKGWEGASKHFKDEIIKGIVNDGVISTNVDVNHLERIVRIVEETK